MQSANGFDTIATALGHRQRRLILLELMVHNPVEQVELQHDDKQASEDGQDIELIHCHLPKLDNLGYIDWDREEGTIVKGQHWAEIEPVLGLLKEHDERTPADTF